MLFRSDEAYIHFGESKELESALPYVRQAKNVVVARTFSKIGSVLICPFIRPIALRFQIFGVQQERYFLAAVVRA